MQKVVYKHSALCWKLGMDESQEAQGGLEERLGRHRGLREQVERMLEELENTAGRLNTADEAEDALVARMREMGRLALQGWAGQREQAAQPAKKTGMRRNGKKNCAG